METCPDGRDHTAMCASMACMHRYGGRTVRMLWLGGTIAMLAVCLSCQQQSPLPLSQLVMADHRSEKQLIAGFWPLEGGRWRWTKRRFAVVLLPPRGSEVNGATLRLQLFIPPQEIDRVGPVTLTADVHDYCLGAEKFTTGGTHTYTRDIPAAFIGHNMLPVLFDVDKPPDDAKEDNRELGVVVNSVSLERKGVATSR